MYFEGSTLYFEKNISILWGSFLPDFNGEEYKNFNLVYEDVIRKTENISTTMHSIYIEYPPFNFSIINLNSYLFGQNRPFFQEIFQNDKSFYFHEKNLFNFTGSEIQDTPNIKRRKRRSFANEDERRIARIMKNRRTAEESRQRRIKRMKSLEDLAAESDYREERLIEELYYLGKLSARNFLNNLIK